MARKLKMAFGYLQIRYAIHANTVLTVLVPGFALASLMLLFVRAWLPAIITGCTALIEAGLLIFYITSEKRRYKNFGVHKVDLQSGEIHFRLLNLKGIGKEAIERDAVKSYISIFEEMVRDQNREVFIVTHKTFIRCMFTAMRQEGIAEVSRAALVYLLDNMIEYNDSQPISLMTNPDYTVTLTYTGMKQNRLSALRKAWPTRDAVKKYIKPIPYFMLTVSRTSAVNTEDGPE